MRSLQTGLYGLQRLFWRLVPETLFHPGFFLRGPQEFRISALPLSADATVRLQELARLGRPISVELDPGLALKRVVSLPKAAISDADKAIALQVRQTMPAQASGLTWRSSVVETRENLVDYNVYVLKQEQIVELLGEITNQGGRLHSVCLRGVRSEPFATGRSSTVSWRNRWLAATIVAVLVASFVQVFLLERKAREISQSNAERSARLDQAEADLLRAKEQVGKAEGERLLVQEDIDLFNGQSQPLEMLADLTATLPDTVWISEFSIGDSQVALSGFASGDVAEVVQKAQGLAWVKEARLQGPAVVDSYGRQTRFDLAIDLEAGNPEQ